MHRAHLPERDGDDQDDTFRNLIDVVRYRSSLLEIVKVVSDYDSCSLTDIHQSIRQGEGEEKVKDVFF